MTTIGASLIINGQVTSREDITIHGTMAGDISAEERVELTDTASVSGTLLSPAVVMREGAFFNGAIAVDRHPKKGR